MTVIKHGLSTTTEVREDVRAHHDRDRRTGYPRGGEGGIPPQDPDQAKNVKVYAGTSHCETYEELVEWLKSREVSCARRRAASRSWELNPRIRANCGRALAAAST